MILLITILNTFRILPASPSHSIIEILNISRWSRDNYYKYSIILLAVQETLKILYFSFSNFTKIWLLFLSYHNGNTKILISRVGGGFPQLGAGSPSWVRVPPKVFCKN